MNVNEQIKINRKLLKHRNWLLVGVTMMLLSNVLISSYLYRVDSKVVIVPSQVREEFYVTDKKVSEGYLESMTRDFAFLILNLTSENYQYVEATVLKLTTPEYYEKMKHELDALATDIKQRNVTTSFFPKEILVDNEQLITEVQGVLDTKVGLTTVSRENKVYRMVFDYSLGYLSLKEFYEVKDGV